MNSVMRCRSKTIAVGIGLISRHQILTKDWIVALHAMSVNRCRCQLSIPWAGAGTGITSRYFHQLRKRSSFHSIQALATTQSSSFASTAKDTKTLGLHENVCAQGVQGDISGDCNFNLWLENCRRYGLENCDQQLQGIQTGRKTIAEVMAEQDQLIADIAAEYQKQAAERRQVPFQGVQQDINMNSLPDINTPCPQGVQGEDCARFKLWLENCHKFQFSNCQDQLDNYHKGRITLAQLFEDQYAVIREAARVASSKQEGNQDSTSTDGITVDVPEPQPAKPVTSAQKLRNAVAVYGSTVMVFHISMSLMSLGFFYTLVSSGIDVVGILTWLGIGETVLKSKLATGTGTFVVAYAVHKVFAPARIAVTLTATPLIVRYLRGIGFLKTPPPKK